MPILRSGVMRFARLPTRMPLVGEPRQRFVLVIHGSLTSLRCQVRGCSAEASAQAEKQDFGAPLLSPIPPPIQPVLWGTSMKALVKTERSGGLTLTDYCGTIKEMGSEVTGLEIGQRVTGEGHITCGFCRNCRAGRRHLCRETVGVGVNRPGAFAEYLCLPSINVFKLSDNVSDDIASFMDALGNATHTALSFNLIMPVITHRYDVDQFDEGFSAMLSGQAGKIVLNWK
eukprot:g20657.t1